MSSNYGDTSWQDVLSDFGEQNAAMRGPVMDPQQTSAYAARDMSLGAEVGKSKQLQQDPIESFTQRVDSDGNNVYDAKGVSQAAYEQLQELIQAGQQSKRETQELTSRLRAKRDVMEKHPAIAQIGRIAAAAANAYIAPGSRGAGLVHGAGAVAGEYFKDTPESLQADISEAERRQTATQVPITGMAIAEARTQEQIKHQREVEDRLEKQRIATEKKNDLMALHDRMGTIMTTAANGTKYPAATVRSQAIAYGATPAQADAYVQQAEDAFNGYEARKTLDSRLTLDRQLAGIKAEAAANLATGLALQRARNEADEQHISLGAAATGMEKLSGELDTLSKGRETGLMEIEYWDNVLRNHEVRGFIGPKTTPAKTAKKIIDVLGTEKYEDREGKFGTVSSLFSGLVEADGKPLSPQAIRKKVEDSIAAVGYYDKRAPNIYNQYDSRKKSLPTKAQAWFPDLRPGGYMPPPTLGGGGGAAPAPAAPPAAAPVAAQVAAKAAAAPPNRIYTKDLGAAGTYGDGTYDLEGKPVQVKNGRIWGK